MRCVANRTVLGDAIEDRRQDRIDPTQGTEQNLGKEESHHGAGHDDAGRAGTETAKRARIGFHQPWRGENGGDKLVHGSGGISQPRAE